MAKTDKVRVAKKDKKSKANDKAEDKKKLKKNNKAAKAESVETDSDDTESKGNKVTAAMYGRILDGVEKQFSLSTFNMNNVDRLSTGMLCIDVICGGGISTGTMAQISGLEKGGKSTLSLHTFGEALRQNTPINLYFDAENALNNVIARNALNLNLNTVFEGAEKRARLYTDSGLEIFYNSIRAVQKRIPDKRFDAQSGEWFYVVDSDKDGKKIADHFGFTNPAKSLSQKTGRLWYPAPDGKIQGFIVCDSYPSLIPELLDDKEEGGGGMAANARAFSDNIRKISGRMRSKGFVLLGVNQIRLNPGERFGCLHGDTQIPFVDGRYHTMQEIVDGKIKGKVWAWDEKAQTFVAAPIVNWFYNGDVTEESDWITISSNEAVATKNGVVSTTVTPDHKILTDKGWKKAKDVSVGDDILSKYPSILNGTLEQFVLGATIGDSTLVHGHSKTSASMRLQDRKNPEYLQWKLKKLEALNFSAWKDKHSSQPSHELSLLKETIRDRNPLLVYEKLSPLSLAVLYMDDGHFREDRGRATISLKRFKGDKLTMGNIAHCFLEQFDLGWKVWEEGVLAIDRESEDRFFKLIRKYVPPCMQYKLPEAHQGFYKEFSLKHKETIKSEWIAVTSITRGSDRKFRKKAKYDIEVKGFHNYLAGNQHNGFVVHNSPEYEPGGQALRFYSSLRIQTRPRVVPDGQGWTLGRKTDGSATKEFSQEPSVFNPKKMDRYAYVYMRNTKNKGGTPFLETWMRIQIRDHKDEGRGYCPVYDTLNYLRWTGRLEGKMSKKFKINYPAGDKLHKNFSTKTWEYNDFKKWILAQTTGNKELTRQVNQEIGPIFDLRKKLFKEVKSGAFSEMLIGSGKEENEDMED